MFIEVVGSYGYLYLLNTKEIMSLEQIIDGKCVVHMRNSMTRFVLQDYVEAVKKIKGATE